MRSRKRRTATLLSTLASVALTTVAAAQGTPPTPPAAAAPTATQPPRQQGGQPQPVAEPQLVVAVPGNAPKGGSHVFDVLSYGAKGDGKTLDTKAINTAIEAAAAAGGGTVYFRAGTYPSYSIHLKSNVALYFDQGSTLLAAEPGNGVGYDEVEPGAKTAFQDFGHSHWHNSLMWGENLENVSILGPGLIYGKGLSKTQGQRGLEVIPLAADKVLAIKVGHNINIRDVSFLHAGHFAILATGVDNLTIDNIKIDTNRDGIDIDACRNVRISNVSVNSPWDDAIVLKTSYGLDEVRATENVTITNSFVSGGFEEGTLLNGTFKRIPPEVRVARTGRVKLGTESNGDYKNITISNIVFDNSNGLALESVDGSHIEDITISNITMRDVVAAPIFIRLGARMRGPEGMEIGTIKRVNISDVVVYGANPRFSSIISGIPGHQIEDVKFNNIQIYVTGGAPKEQADVVPSEQEKAYPEPSMFGTMPAYGFFIRHVKGIEFNNVEVRYLKEDQRPAFVLDDVQGADFLHLKAQKTPNVPTFVLKNVEDFTTSLSRPVGDKYILKTALTVF